MLWNVAFLRETLAMTSPENSESPEDKSEAPNALTPLEMLSFVMRAARRHVRLGVTVGISTVVLGMALAKVVPQKFISTSQILVDETFEKTEELSTPERTLQRLDPFSGSFELLTQKGVLMSIVDEAKLMDPSNQPSFLQKVKGLIYHLLGSEQTLDEKREAMARLLDKNLVLKKNKNVVNIWVTWTDPQKAYRIAQLTYTKLMELVRNRNNATFSAAISILEDEAKRAGEAIEPALTEVVRAREQSKKSGTSETTRSSSPTLAGQVASLVATHPRAENATTPASNTETAAREGRIFSAKLADLNSKIQVAEDAWHRQQTTLDNRLAELRTVYGEAHPQIVQQKALIKEASEPPPELSQLHRARTELLNEIQNRPDEAAPASPSNRAPRRMTGAVVGERIEPRLGTIAEVNADVSPETAAARAKLSRAIDAYNGVVARLASARLQLVTSQSTFGMRFVVTIKPELPLGPSKPVRLMVRLASIMLAGVFGMIAGAIRELFSGVIHDPIQAKSFGLKDLGELAVYEPQEH